MQECHKLMIKLLKTLKNTRVCNGHIRMPPSRPSGWVKMGCKRNKWCGWYSRVFGFIYRYEIKQYEVTKLTHTWNLMIKKIWILWSIEN